MTAKQNKGAFAPDGSTYITLVDGAGSLVTISPTAYEVGVTSIASGTTTRILYDNAGVLGEYTLTGTGTVVVMATSPTVTTPVITGASKHTGVAIAALNASPAIGMVQSVTDALTPAVGSTVVAGGAAKALVWYNGANWTVIGV